MFTEGDKVYYVCPFNFTIEKVKLEMLFRDHTGMYWIDSAGAYLHEFHLARTMEEAKKKANEYLHDFCVQKQAEICVTEEDWRRENDLGYD